MFALATLSPLHRFLLLSSAHLHFLPFPPDTFLLQRVVIISVLAALVVVAASAARSILIMP